MIVVIGDVLLDREISGHVNRLAPDAPVPVLSDLVEGVRLGGAGMAAQRVRELGHEVLLVAAVSRDHDGDVVRKLAHRAGITLAELPTVDSTRCKERIGTTEQVLMRIDRGTESCTPTSVPPGLFDLCRRVSALLVSDYGGGVTHHQQIRDLVGSLVSRMPVVWDPHPRGAIPLERLTLITPNRIEARADHDVEQRARELAAIWNSPVAITIGAQGAVACLDGIETLSFPARHVVGDTCGAGDAFAAAVTLALANGEVPAAAIARGVEHATAWVEVDKRSSARPVVVATGGCFDLLHVGHIETLRSAAALGDRLVVLLNSDRSVREIKGPDRPLNNQRDRAEVLRALSMVDEVIIFDEPTPESALATLQPDIWVKGGDYEGVELPESVLLKQWGGQTVIAPYVAGYSTSQLVNGINS